MAYIECPECRRKALSVATRCPHCGFNYPSRPLRRPAPGLELDRLLPGLAVAGVLAAGVVAVALLTHRAGPRAVATAPGTGLVPAPGTPPAVSAPTAAAPPTSLPAPDLVPPARAVPPQPAATPAVVEGSRRFARTWVNIRGDRGRRAPAVRVLSPGDPVLVDSLRRGWYRVLVDGQAVGYVHRSNLDPTPPAATP